ncbi:hypothetical protein CDAR_239791 [Caerostris darwini]|uniref:Uncharacterized protein n=1 Tax=Caerostris darwini TaxID=1538125 RepID=A0AAV4QYN9_9ARAC|nr:hypothetical protein CDAR_239791 [Caerostris darwini]
MESGTDAETSLQRESGDGGNLCRLKFPYRNLPTPLKLVTPIPLRNFSSKGDPIHFGVKNMEVLNG